MNSDTCKEGSPRVSRLKIPSGPATKTKGSFMDLEWNVEKGTSLDAKINGF